MCKHMVEFALMDLSKVHFNYVLLCIDVSCNPEMLTKYRLHNPHYTSVVLQCAMKIDYLFESLQEEYPKVKFKKDSLEEDSNTNMLFTFPSMQPERPKVPMIQEPTEKNVKTVVISNAKNKQKTTYDITRC